jgi:hypothetical protein
MWASALKNKTYRMRHSYFNLFCCLLISGIIFHSCEKDNVEEMNLQSTGVCDSSKAVSFKNQVEPLFKNECGSQSGCHGSGSALGGVNLEDPQKILDVVRSGLLMKSLDHSTGISPMPKGRPQIDDCRRNLLRKWIREGTDFSN